MDASAARSPATPGTYPVEVQVADGAGHFGFTTFDVVVAAENATATYTRRHGRHRRARRVDAQATLRFTVLDGSDAAPGDVATATRHVLGRRDHAVRGGARW